MAQSRGRVVGDYLVGRQIGSGSFSVVWLARHRVHGTEVAIKEIPMNRLNNKLRESLMSEIAILRRINHSNIIRLHDIIEDQVSGKIHLVLEYCRGGDLSLYIQRHGCVPEETAKHFMQQLATGLQILRENNFVHRDLKPQNLLLSTNDDRSVLKIADFGFARSLQPRGLAETLCGSPLYMAPEIMQLQKYDAKADLWSVGAILYQLVTGKTPFTGSNQYHLLQNIIKSTELQFPPESMDLSFECKDLCLKLLRRNPVALEWRIEQVTAIGKLLDFQFSDVERLTYEEFFNHPFLSRKQLNVSSRTLSRTMDGYPLSETDPVKAEESSQDDCFPFFLDDENNACGGSPSNMKRRSLMESAKGLNLSKKLEKRGSESSAIPYADLTFRYGSTAPNLGANTFRLDIYGSSETNTDHPSSMDRRSASSHSRVADSMDLIDQDYVIVPGPPLEVSSSSTSASKQSHLPYDSVVQASTSKTSPSSAPVPIIGASINSSYHIGSLESHGSAPGTSLDSMDIGDPLEKPSSNCRTRIKSLQKCASCIKELVAEKSEGGLLLEAFSIQLVILAIWKQALHICHTQAASAMEGSPGQGNTRLKRSNVRRSGSASTDECLGDSHTLALGELSSQIEGEFFQAVEHAEELAKVIEPGGTEMPDAMETIFQAALAFGRRGGVDELMGNMETAASMYEKAVNLLIFLLVEAPSLILNPPFSLTNSDRCRLHNYIEILNNRQCHLRSQGMALLKSEG